MVIRQARAGTAGHAETGKAPEELKIPRGLSRFFLIFPPGASPSVDAIADHPPDGGA